VGTTHLREKKERKGEKERRLEKGERRKEKGERRKEKGERRKEKGERRKEKGKRKKKGYPIPSQSSSELAQHREIHARLSARMRRINQPWKPSSTSTPP
jgi:hypothetical protein